MYNIFLDFDGVIADTIKQHATAFKEIAGLDIRVEDIISMQFRKEEYGPNATKTKLITDDLYQDYESFKNLTTKQCEMVMKMDFELFTDFVDVVSNIRSKKIAIITNSSRAIIDFALTKLAVHGLKIDTISTIEDGASKTTRMQAICKDWNVKPSEVYFVTDTTYDVKEAQGLFEDDKIIGVAWGYHPYQKLNTLLPAGQILIEPDELYRAIELESTEVFEKNVEKRVKKIAKKQLKQEERDALEAKEREEERKFLEEQALEDQKTSNKNPPVRGQGGTKNPEPELDEELESEEDSEKELDNDFEYQSTTFEVDRKYTLLDSTGIRRPGQRTFGAESFATFQTIEAAYKADVICMVVDGSQPITHQDQVVAGILKEAKKGVVVIINKSDLLGEEDRVEFIKEFTYKFAFLKVKKFVWVSAKNSKGLDDIWEQIDDALDQKSQEISRDETRKIFNYLMKQKPPAKLRLKKRPIVYDLIYTNKNGTPLFELLCKDKTAIHWSYLRFLENTLRKNFNFDNTEIKVKAVNLSKQQVMVK